MESNDLTHAMIGAAIEVHRVLGPGLLEMNKHRNPNEEPTLMAYIGSPMATDSL